MMKNRIITFFLSYFLISFSYVYSISQNRNNRIVDIADSLYPSCKGTFVLLSENKSLLGWHFFLKQEINGIELFGSFLILHLNVNLKLFDHRSHVFVNFPTNHKVDSHFVNPIWVFKENVFYLMNISTFNDSRSNPWLVIHGTNNDTFGKFPLFLPFRDTIIKAKVFMPNPITTSRTSYNYPFVDFNDRTNDYLNGQRKNVTMKTRHNGNYFILENDFLKIVDISPPNFAAFQSSSPEFYYSRNQHEFEDVNVYYHINAQIEYLIKLGYKALISLINVDTHALMGADQSLFKFINLPNTIEFGTGGVDDAEDAEVIVHEYAHAISFNASPRTTINADPERLAIEEGWADYFCVSHFRRINKHNWEKIFDWDGHNEFWDGINTNTKKLYNQNLSGKRDEDRELWSTPLLCIADKLGKELADTIILESLFFLTQKSNMAEVAKQIVKIDSILFKGVNSRIIKECFFKQKILDRQGPDFYMDSMYLNLEYRFLNTSGFSINEGPICIKFKQNVNCILRVYSLTGALIFDDKYYNRDYLILNPELFKGGIYNVRIEFIDKSNKKSFNCINERIIKI